MDYFSLKLTDENIKNTFIQSSVNRNIELINLIRILDNVNDNFTFSIDGKWGSGKTFFVKHACLVLNCMNNIYREQNNCDPDIKITDHWKQVTNRYGINTPVNTHVAVYYDAWENDNDLDPVISIIYQIALQLGNMHELEENNINIKKAIESIVAYKMKSTNNPYGEIINLFEKNNLASEIKEQNILRSKIQEFLQNLANERGNRIDIFIDELDRCKPTYAVHLLEVVKHYFVSENISFVFSTNLTELSKTIQCVYGSEFNATRYLDRFFDLRMTLTLPNNFDDYLRSIRFGYITRHEQYAVFFAQKLGFQLREFNNYAKRVKISLQANTNSIENNNSNYVLLGVICPFLIALQMYDLEIYQALIEGNGKQYFSTILSDIPDASRFYNCLLSQNETYENNNSSTSVNKSDKVEELYSVLFPLTQFDASPDYRTTIGNLTFTESLIKELRWCLSLCNGNLNFDEILINQKNN